MLSGNVQFRIARFSASRSEAGPPGSGCRLLICAAATALGLAACGSQEGLEISGPTTASKQFVDFPPGPVSVTAAEVEQRLRVAGLRITVSDRANGFVRSRSTLNGFVDCGTIFETVDGQTITHPGNSARLLLADELAPGGRVVREVDVVSSAGMGISSGRTNTVVVTQVHQVTLRTQTAGGSQLSTETIEFTDRGFAQFADGTVCRSSDLMTTILS